MEQNMGGCGWRMCFVRVRACARAGGTFFLKNKGGPCKKSLGTTVLATTTNRRTSAALTLSATSSYGLTCKSVHHHTLLLRFFTHPSCTSLRRKKETKTEHYCVMGWCSDAVRRAGRLLLACGRHTLFLITQSVTLQLYYLIYYLFVVQPHQLSHCLLGTGVQTTLIIIMLELCFLS